MRGWGTWAAALAAIGAIGCARNLAPPREIDLEYEGPIRSRDIVEGGRIYTTLCTACHRGRVNPRGYSWSPGQMRHQIREGNRLMPPLSDELLSDTQVEAVLAYLSVMGALDGDLPPVRNGELDLDEELADAELEDEERELVGATESPELPASTQPEPRAAESSATEPQTAVASGAEPETTVAEPSVAEPERAVGEPSVAEPSTAATARSATGSDGPREGATGLAPPSGNPTDSASAEVPVDPLTVSVDGVALRALAMSFVFGTLKNGRQHELAIRVHPTRATSVRFRTLRAGDARVRATRWRIAGGEWVPGSQAISLDAGATLEIELAHPVSGTGGPFEASLVVDGRPVQLTVPTRTSHESSLPI